MIENDWVGSSILSGQDWEPHIVNFLKRNLTKNSVFVDVGSNYGWHSINLSSYCDKVYSFEPQKVLYDLQSKSINYNKITNIKLFNCGLGNKNENSRMNRIDYETSVNVGDLSVGTDGEEISISTLDTQIPNGFDFMKIDVQGYEKFVLEGGVENIKNHTPTIIIEMEDHQLRKFGYGCEELFNFIRDLGYTIYLLDYHYPSDHVCVHKNKLDEFIITNKDWIKPLGESNNLNKNIENGVKEKIID